jgi:hypothetical protein
MQQQQLSDDLSKAVKAVTRKIRYNDAEARTGITRTDCTTRNQAKHKERKTRTKNKETTQQQQQQQQQQHGHYYCIESNVCLLM